jgi:hypothetical protein
MGYDLAPRPDLLDQKDARNEASYYYSKKPEVVDIGQHCGLPDQIRLDRCIGLLRRGYRARPASAERRRQALQG